MGLNIIPDIKTRTTSLLKEVSTWLTLIHLTTASNWCERKIIGLASTKMLPFSTVCKWGRDEFCQIKPFHSIGWLDIFFYLWPFSALNASVIITLYPFITRIVLCVLVSKYDICGIVVSYKTAKNSVYLKSNIRRTPSEFFTNRKWGPNFQQQ